MKTKRLSWRSVEALCSVLAKQIKRAHYGTDVIVAIARGGWVPARILSGMLRCEGVASMRVVRGARGMARITQPVSCSVRNRRVLLVDDVADAGSSIAAAAAHLRRRWAREIKVAVLNYKQSSKIEPDFFGERNANEWITYPWEKEDERNQEGTHRRR